MPCKTCHKSASEVEFYNSISTYCKEHWRERVRANRDANSEHYKAFDRARANLPARVDARRSYIRTEAGKAAHARALKKWRNKNPKICRAHNALNNAIKRGKVLPMPCIVCGKDAEAHHPDYDQPLDVIWLCDEHHKEVHTMAKELAA